MRNLMILAAVLVGLGTYMAQMADKISPAPASASPSPKKADTETVAQASGRSLNIPPDARGHFQTDGRIEGQRISFMIDTGASLVALNEKLRGAVRPASFPQRLQRDCLYPHRHHQGFARAACR